MPIQDKKSAANIQIFVLYEIRNNIIIISMLKNPTKQ